MTLIQKLGLTIGILGILAGASAQLTDILSPIGAAAPIIVKEVTALAGFAGGILGFVLSFMTGQANAVKAVQAMPGVERIVVNSMANQTLAQLTVDPAQSKIEAAPGAEKAIETTAKGT